MRASGWHVCILWPKKKRLCYSSAKILGSYTLEVGLCIRSEGASLLCEWNVMQFFNLAAHLRRACVYALTQREGIALILRIEPHENLEGHEGWDHGRRHQASGRHPFSCLSCEEMFVYVRSMCMSWRLRSWPSILATDAQHGCFSSADSIMLEFLFVRVCI